MKTNVQIGVLGLWHLGSVYAASLAKLGFNVTGFDENQTIVKNLQKAKPPIEEPLLTETVKEYLRKNLEFTSKPEEAITKKNYLFVTYDTPVDDRDRIDLSPIERTFKLIKKDISPDTTIVVSSQVPVGTCRKALLEIQKKEPSVNIIYFPENLRLGKAFDSFLKPDRVVIGSNNDEALDKFEKDFSALNCPFIKIGLESAEMTKHALNAYLATMISFSSEISDLCEMFGADMTEVVLALKTETRVSKTAPLNPGLGFAGGTLGRDVQTLKKLATDKKYEPSFLNSVYKVNQNRLPQLVKKLKAIEPHLKNKTVGILGLTYKPNTNTLRRSMSLELATLLNEEAVKIIAYDPTVKDKIENYPYIIVKTSLSKLLTDSDLVVLMTEWKEFNNIDWKKLKNKPIIFDAKNFFDKKEVEEANFTYYGIGYPL